MNKKEYNNNFFYWGLIGIACIFTLFYTKQVYYWDTPLHTLVAKSLLFHDVEYDQNNISFPTHALAYPVYHFFQKIVHCVLGIDYESAAALILSVSIIVSVLLYRKLSMMIIENTVWNRYFADFCSIGTVLFGVARCWLNDWRYYKIQCGPNPFHNPTILFVRPFAIASFIFFILFIRTYRNKTSWYKYAILFSIMMLISVGAKPSFAIVFLPAMGVYTIYYMIQNKELRFGIIAFISVLPSLILLLIQQIWVSMHTKALDVYIEFGFFRDYNEFHTQQEILWAVIMASLVTFPVVFLLFRFKLMKQDAAFFIVIVALGFGWFEMFFLKSAKSGDFSWGYDLAVQFATLIALMETRRGEKAGKLRKVVNYSAYLIFIYQVFTGLKYLWLVYTNLNVGYWI